MNRNLRLQFDAIFNPYSQGTEAPSGLPLLSRFGSGELGLSANQHSECLAFED